ncbi:cytochrome c oxidase accessory protein CcoG [Magnetospira sp. QH-2]|uniref:cytochrome c oxidase accessory protein CcoG n=1 Tax=Magnetospira sp. (strain QH-2) TaxID=1288970 RepID=UPI0003E81A6A|nr:cytochrome c oxidase accessory protein CcoG [Magnetospira sp. QH-2]CCQ72124.1 nitrogen fixation protein fixG [Magnetospira sp. QH-2]
MADSNQTASNQPMTPPPLFAATQAIYPRDIKGTFRTVKWVALWVLLGIYYVFPWLKWTRGEGVTDQFLLLDMAGRRGYIGPIEIWPQEVYYLTGVLILAAIGLFFSSALLGRVWCGFACFQTVWTDLFMWVERRIEGDRNKRIAADKKPMNLAKLSKKLVKHILWMFIALATAGYFVFYFVEADVAFWSMLDGTAGGWTYSVVGTLTFTTYMAAGWAREQICIYMCPYPRFQAAMFDEDTFLVTYEEWRGEPRAKFNPKQGFDESRGHCVDCGMCVHVCPTGVDIRKGNQLACIGCALCVDACNTVMDRFKMPRNLIAYDSERNQVLRSQGGNPVRKWVRPRTIGYTVLMIAVMAIMAIGFSNRASIEINILRDRAPLFVRLSDGNIRNGYTYKILNMVSRSKTYELSLKGIDGALMTVIGYQKTPSAKATLPVKSDTVGTFKVYVKSGTDVLDGESTDLDFVLTDTETGESVSNSSVFRAPRR